MGGVVSGIVNASKKCFEFSKSFFTEAWQTTKNYAQETFEKVKQGAAKAKEYIKTKIAGNIEEVLSVAALVSSPVIFQ